MEVRLFFEFLQVAIGNRESLSRELSDNEWQDIFRLLKEHALLGVGFSAVERLHAKGVVCPPGLRMKWFALVVQIERRNEQLNGLCKKVTEQYEHDGLSTCILKGQGNILNYPKELGRRRQSGDIDVWAVHFENEECRMKKQRSAAEGKANEECTEEDGGIAIAVQTGKNEVEYVEYHGHKAIREYVMMQYRLKGIDAHPKACYHHIDAPDMDGIEVEVHYRPTFCRSFIRNRRMQKWFDTFASECMSNRTSEGFAVPTASFNVVYQMAHLFEHYFEGGIGLRQMMDYHFTLKAWQEEIMEWKSQQSQGMWSEGLGTPVMSAQEVMAVIRSFGMGKFAAAVMYVLHKVFENEECILNEECSEADDVVERELSQIKRELKEIGPQADDMGEQQLFTHCKFKEEFIKLKQVSSIGQQLKEKCVCEPWMICEPNEKEGRKLLEEIMKGGNFGQYDNRDAALKNGGMVKHGVWKLKRVMRLVRSYPEEALWEPVFRVWHLGWRKIHG